MNFVVQVNYLSSHYRQAEISLQSYFNTPPIPIKMITQYHYTDNDQGVYHTRMTSPISPIMVFLLASHVLSICLTNDLVIVLRKSSTPLDYPVFVWSMTKVWPNTNIPQLFICIVMVIDNVFGHYIYRFCYRI